MEDAWGVSTSCSMDVFNVGKIKMSICGRSICYDALLGGTMVFVSPLLDVNHSQMLTSINNFENERSFGRSLVGNSNGSCWSSSSFDTKGSSFDVLPLSKLKLTLDI